jgi:transposase
LQQWVNRLDTLIANKFQESNRLEDTDPEVTANIQSHIDFINERIKEVEKLIANHIKQHKDLNDKSQLFASIPGIGEKTIAVILAFLANMEDFDSAKQVAAFVGLNLKPRLCDLYTLLQQECKMK